MTQVRLLLSEVELEDIMSEVQATGSGHLRRAASGWFGPGDS